MKDWKNGLECKMLQKQWDAFAVSTYGCSGYVDRKWLVELIPWIKVERNMFFNTIRTHQYWTQGCGPIT